VYRVGAHKTSTPPVQAPLPLPDKPSIAVLPFQNISGDPEQEVFADGMVEDITTALSKLRWFFVIARNSSFSYKGRAVDVKQVGRELGVRYVLEGSVRKSGNRLRITAQLVEAETGNHVWAERYDRDLGDIFAVQDEITERVVAAIEPELYAAENIRSRRKPPESLDAWECVIRALSYFSQSTPDAIAEAEALCRRAITIAPGYAQAHSFLAWALVRSATWAGGIAAVLPAAAAEAQTALRLDERDPWGHLTYGVVLWRMRRPAQAERAFRRALELNPNFALACAYLGNALADLGAHNEAIENANRALRLSPNDRLVELRVFIVRTNVYFAAKRYGDATAEAGKMIERFPEIPGGHFLLVATAALQEDMQTAAAALSVAARVAPGLTVAKLRDDAPFVGDAMDRFLEGLRKAGVSET